MENTNKDCLDCTKYLHCEKKLAKMEQPNGICDEFKDMFPEPIGESIDKDDEDYNNMLNYPIN